jgi:hypothetical protein
MPEAPTPPNGRFSAATWNNVALTAAPPDIVLRRCVAAKQLAENPERVRSPHPVATAILMG